MALWNPEDLSETLLLCHNCGWGGYGRDAVVASDSVVVCPLCLWPVDRGVHETGALIVPQCYADSLWEWLSRES